MWGSNRRTLMLVLLALSSLAGQAAIAQVFEEIVVTAQKREQNAQDIGIAVTAFSGDQLKALGVNNAKDIADITPGVQINMEYGNAPTFTIRGVSVNDFVISTTPAAAVYVDGVYMATSINSGPQLFDIERVEILKGPQGTLWGRNTSAGAVSFITKKPTEEVDGYLEGAIGNYNSFRVEGALGGPLGENSAGRLSIQTQQSDGPYDNITVPGFGVPNNDEAGEVERYAIRGQLLFTPSDELEVLASVHYSSDEGTNAPTTIRGLLGANMVETSPGSGIFTSDCGAVFSGTPDAAVPAAPFGTQNSASCTDLFGYSDPDPFDDEFANETIVSRDNEFFGGVVTVTWDMDAGRLVSITGYESFDRIGGLDFDGSPTPNFPPAADFRNVQIYDQRFDQLSEELRWEHEGDRLFWLAGLYVSTEEIDTRTGGGLFFGTDFDIIYNQETENQALFGHLEWSFSDQLKLILGGRLNREDQEYDHESSLEGALFGLPPGPLVTGTTADPSVIRERDSDEFSYKVGLEWTPTDTALIYLSNARGIKSGGFDNGFKASVADMIPYNEEELTATEIGFKWDPADNLRINASAYIYDYKEIQQRKATFSGNLPVNTFANLDSADVQGLEGELVWNPVEGLDVALSVSFIDTDISESEDPSFDNHELAFAPESAYSALARYEWQIGDSLYAVIQGNWNYTGKHFPDIFNVTWEQQDYSLYGARIALGSADGRWEAAVTGKNLGDEFYVVNVFPGLGSRAYFINEPRSYEATFRYNFF